MCAKFLLSSIDERDDFLYVNVFSLCIYIVIVSLNCETDRILYN
jgi:hypothetical protein